MTIAALLVDFDGTLIDSEKLHQQTITKWLLARGWDDPSHPRTFLGRRALDVFRDDPGPWTGFDPDVLVAEIWEHFEHCVPDPVPGAAELYAWVRSLDLPWALVTSGNRWWINTALTASGLPFTIDDFDAVISAERQEYGKPNPAGYLMAMHEIRRDGAECLVLEDTPAGVQAGRSAGAKLVIGLSTSMPAASLIHAGADLVFADLRPVPDAVGSFSK